MESNYVPIFSSSNRPSTKMAPQPRKRKHLVKDTEVAAVMYVHIQYTYILNTYPLNYFLFNNRNKLKSVIVETELGRLKFCDFSLINKMKYKSICFTMINITIFRALGTIFT